MNELSLHILDICQNSIKAEAELITINIEEDVKNNFYKIVIADNGKGMDKKTLNEATHPLFTTRLTRKVGMGLPLFKMAAEKCNGSFIINSVLNEGTMISAIFEHNHIDRAPLGNIGQTLIVLALNEKKTDIYYEHLKSGRKYIFDTREMRKILNDIPFTDNAVIKWIKDNIRNGFNNLLKEES